MPTTPETGPRIAAMCEAPWISWIRTAGGGGDSTVKVNSWFAAMLSGGSIASLSVTSEARTRTVQVSLAEKSVVGLSVNAVGPPVTVAVCPALDPQEIADQLLVVSTGSLNVIVMFASRATPVAPFAGVVAATDGGASSPHVRVIVRRFRGAGAPTVKFAAFWSVSTHPPSARSAAVVFESVPVGPDPSN